MSNLENLIIISIQSIISLITKSIDISITVPDFFAESRANDRHQAFDAALKQALDSVNYPALQDMVKNPSIQEEIASGLLDPLHGFDIASYSLFVNNNENVSILTIRRFFNALQNNLLRDPLWEKIFGYYYGLRSQDEVQNLFASNKFPITAPLIIREANKYLNDSGAIATGMFSRAVGANGLLVEGNYTQNNINLILEKIVIEYIQPPKEDKNPYHSYLEYFARLASLLPWANLGFEFAAKENSLQLPDVYINLDAVSIENLTSEENIHQAILFEENIERIEISDLVKREQRILLLGEAGSGKTTVIKHLVYALAQAALHENLGEYFLANQGEQRKLPIPIWIDLRRLGNYMNTVKQDTEPMVLINFFQNELKNIALEDCWQEFKTKFMAGDQLVYFFLDGLDEVSNTLRENVVVLINRFCHLYPEHQFLVTSRVYACIDQPWRLNNFKVLSLAPFSPMKIDMFIEKWRLWIVKHRQVSENDALARISRIRKAILRSNLDKIASRPLLLTLMVQLYMSGDTFAEDRTQLYDNFVQLLLNSWENQNDNKGGLLEFLSGTGIKMSDLDQGLSEVAFRSHSQEENPHIASGIEEADLRKWLAPHLGGDWNKAGLFIEFIHNRTGLLVSQKTGIYSFPHRSFQEYLASCHLITFQDYPIEAARLITENPIHWQEVFIYSTAKAANTHRLGLALAAINTLLPWQWFEVNNPTPQEYQVAIIASKAVLEIGLHTVSSNSTGQAILQRIRNWLVSLISQASVLSAEQRCEAGQLLGKIGDVRKEVISLEYIEFVVVPEGSFLMGSDLSSDPDTQKREQPVHEVFLDTFLISKFLITHAQFAAFTCSGGYDQERYWREAKKVGIWEDGKVKGFGDYQPKSAAMDYGEPFNLPNHPVSGVNWYEAIAFSRWLTEKWHGQGILAEDWEVTLPSEAEWEKAARGGIRLPKKVDTFSPVTGFPAKFDSIATELNPMPNRIYPWGNAENPNFANYSATNIFTTSAVGCFAGGISPYGVLDMSGNIWEFTRSIYHDYPYPNDENERSLIEKIDLPDDILRVSRGGSFNHPQRGSRCCDRGRARPMRYDRHGGFLLAIVQKR